MVGWCQPASASRSFPADLNATVRFYVDLLGFSLATDRRSDALPYLALKRDDVQIGAVAVPGGHRGAPASADRRRDRHRGRLPARRT